METANQTYSYVADAWESFVDTFDGGDGGPIDMLMIVVGGWFCGFATYSIYGCLLLLADISKRPQWLMERRYQKKRPYSVENTTYNPSLRKLVVNVLFNWFLVIPPGLYFLQVVCSHFGLGVYVSRELPSLKWILFHIAASWILVDCLFFYSHWFLHTKTMYARIHKVHHAFKTPHALAAIYAHPLEALVGNTFAVMGPAFYLNLHCLEWYIAMIIGWGYSCTSHAGYELPWSNVKDNGFTNFHDYHHEFFRGNYGSNGFFDYLHGTDRKWRAYCEKIKMQTGLKKDE